MAFLSMTGWLKGLAAGDAMRSVPTSGAATAVVAVKIETATSDERKRMCRVWILSTPHLHPRVVVARGPWSMSGHGWIGNVPPGPV